MYVLTESKIVEINFCVILEHFIEKWSKQLIIKILAERREQHLWCGHRRIRLTYNDL